jgi:chromosome segregation ATPase
METTSQPISRRAELEGRIKKFEEEKVQLQREIARIKEMLTTSVLEKRAKTLEGEVAQLKSVKVRLEAQMAQRPKPVVERPAQTSAATKPAQDPPSGQRSPVRYGTWSKLPLP